MKIAFAVERATGALVIVGSVSYGEHNDLHVAFEPAQLARLASGELRPFVLLAQKTLAAWPVMPADLVQHKPTAKLYSAPLHRAPEHRPQTWEGWPLRLLDPQWQLAVSEYDYGQSRPPVDALLLRPLVPVAKLPEHEPKHDGFGIGYLSGPATPKPSEAQLARMHAERDAADVEDDATDEEVAAAHADPPPNGAYTQEMTEEFSEAQARIQAEIDAAPPCACGKARLVSSVERARGKCDLCILDAKIAESGVGPVTIEHADGSTITHTPGGEHGGDVERGSEDGREGVRALSGEGGAQRPVGEGGDGADAGLDDRAGGKRRRKRRVRGDGAAPTPDVPAAADAGAVPGADAPRDREDAPRADGGDTGGAADAGGSADGAGGEPDASVRAPEPEPVRPGVPVDAPSAGLGKPRRKRKEDKQLGLFAAPEPRPAKEEACAICGRPVRDQHGDRACERGHPDGRSRVPLHVVKAYGPSPGPVRVRALGTCGLRFVKAGDEFDAEWCPSPERKGTAVWIVTPEAFTDSAGVSYRLCEGEWEPIDPPRRRRAASLDDL